MAAIAILVTVLASLVQLTSPAERLRERGFDYFLQTATDGTPESVAVVDIDRATLETMGAWPWPRDRLADLVEAIAEARPKAIAFDFLLVGADERSAGALARNLASSAPDERVARIAREMAASLPDADQRLAVAIAKAPVVLGMVLDAEAGSGTGAGPHGVPVLVRGKPGLVDIWRAESAIGAIDVLAKAARGHGVLALPGDADAGIRRVPLIVATRSGLRPGLALESVRLGAESSSYVIRADTGEVRTGTARIDLGGDGMLRLRPTSEARQAARTVSAARIVSDISTRAGLAGRIVLLGSSAPELGGLRPSARGSLVPSVQLQADAVAQILASDAPLRPDWLAVAERGVALAVAAAAAYVVLAGSPVSGGAVALALSALWLAAAARLIGRHGVLIDPFLVPAAALAGFSAALLLAATEARRREAFIRRRFEQHLAPAVVQRIVDEPHLLKLKGEAREITVIFTDIEGFTSLTERAGPVDLVALLDRYIEGASRIIVEHGGMVDKVIGDGMHALFNAPLDLADHPRRALECALALKAFSEALRKEPDAQRLGLGRTRVGIETGPVIVGDVGGGRRLNYTAHGNAVNRAARLEAANKELASTICIGPVAASRLPGELLRPLGKLGLRGVGEEVAVYEPWPDGMDGAARESYAAAFARLADDPGEARRRFAVLARRFPDDRVIARLAGREADGAI